MIENTRLLCHSHTHTYTHIRTHTHTHIHAHTHTHIHAHTHTHTRTDTKHACTELIRVKEHCGNGASVMVTSLCCSNEVAALCVREGGREGGVGQLHSLQQCTHKFTLCGICVRVHTSCILCVHGCILCVHTCVCVRACVCACTHL